MKLPVSSVREYNGVPTLFVNETPQTGLAYITYVDEAGRFRSFREAGYRLFSCSVCFGDRPINALNKAKAMRHGIFEVNGEEHYEYFDRAIERILGEVPDALIFPRLNVSPPAWWEEDNPDACNDSGYNGGPRRFCFASHHWISAAKEALRKFFAHIETTPFRDHLIGWQIAGGNTEEWLSTDLAGSQGAASRSAFAEKEADDTSASAYHHFLSEAAAEAVMELASTVKELTGHRLAVGTFYGYLLETPFWASCHHALSKILRCPDIDFLCSPDSYSARLTPELGWPAMTTIASITHHGKLYFFEFDTRTHRTGLFHEALPEVCPPDAYTEAIWQPLSSENAALNALRMNFAQQMSMGVASWWFDMWGGWFDTPAIMTELAKYRIVAEELMQEENRGGVAQCACFVDEWSYAQTKSPTDRPASPHAARMALLHSGVPCDFYEISDFSDVAARYRALFFIVPNETKAIREAHAWCKTHSKPWLDFADIHNGDKVGAEQEFPDAKAVREFCLQNQVHCYNDAGHAVYVSRNLIAFHAAFSGTATLKLRTRCRVIPLFPAGEEFVGEEVVQEVQAGDTEIFRLHEISEMPQST